MDDAGLKIPVDLRIASTFSRRMTDGNASPALAIWEGNHFFALIF